MESAAQDRWNQYGREQSESIKQDPDKFRIDQCPGIKLPIRRDLVRALGDIRGQKILDLGCGRGEFSVWLAKQGAEVFGVDLGEDLIDAAERLADANGVRCDFRQGNIVDLPFESGKFDIVVGLAILHHLSERDARTAVGECLRTLRKGGIAVFQEPVENSKVFDFIQNIVPAGGKKPRPSILNRRKWREHLAALDDRVMTDAELKCAGLGFSSVDIRHYGLTVRLVRIVGTRFREKLTALDEWLLRFDWLGRYSQAALVIYRK